MTNTELKQLVERQYDSLRREFRAASSSVSSAQDIANRSEREITRCKKAILAGDISLEEIKQFSRYNIEAVSRQVKFYKMAFGARQPPLLYFNEPFIFAIE
jgi:hypothetical protein